MLIYLDASSLLKTLLPEPESIATLESLGRESDVLISPLAELECRVRLRAALMGGNLRASHHQRALMRLDALNGKEPYRFCTLSAAVFSTAMQQLAEHPTIHCKSLDRLHLAAMEELGVKRIMTNDDQQARAARALGYEVLQPGRTNAAPPPE